MMTYAEAAQLALDVQDACNLSGVLFYFADAMHAICEEQQSKNLSTDWKNTHPIVTLFLDKLNHLNHRRFDDVTAYNADYNIVKTIARG